MSAKTTKPACSPRSLAAMFCAQAKYYQDRVLYRYWQEGQWRSLSWNEALCQVRQIALGWISLGISRGDRIVLLSGNRLEWHLIDWANLCIGALTVPLYSSSSAAQAMHIIGHADPAALVIESVERIETLDFSRAILNQLKAIVAVDLKRTASIEALPAKVLSLEVVKDLGRVYDERHPGVFEMLVDSIRPEDDLTIIYTSGTTGVPKGVVTTHAHYLFMIQAVDAAVPSTDQDVTLHFLPTAHSLGRLEHFMAVAKGWTLGIARSIETVGSDLRAIRPTVIFSVPRIYENAYNRIRLRLGRARTWRRKIFEWTLAKSMEQIDARAHGVGGSRGRDLAVAIVDRLAFASVRRAFGGRLRLAISGGAPLAPEIAKFFHAVGIVILEGYGLTETATVSHVNRPENFRLATVGLPLPGTECRIAGDGEILLRGPHIFKAYFRDLMASEEAIDAAGWFHTGDIGEVDGQGFLRVTDRKKDLIVSSGGKKVAPQRLENLLKADSLISQALIVGAGQPHLSALITLDNQRVLERAAEQGVAVDPENLAVQPWVQNQVRQIIQKTNKQVAPFEAIRNFCILDKDFTVESEELTPTLKPRRQIIVERYKKLIEDLYRKAS
jgi:long-chain acyl-CoA synthetase